MSCQDNTPPNRPHGGSRNGRIFAYARELVLEASHHANGPMRGLPTTTTGSDRPASTRSTSKPSVRCPAERARHAPDRWARRSLLWSVQHCVRLRSSIACAGFVSCNALFASPLREIGYLRRVPPVPLARLRARVDRRTTVVARKTARKASLTASDVGNASATSGWSATSVVPFRRPAYLPRTPGPSEAKSYSGRRSSAPRRLAFFIGAALTTRGWSG
jgi:hypothetical protein